MASLSWLSDLKRGALNDAHWERRMQAMREKYARAHLEWWQGSRLRAVADSDPLNRERICQMVVRACVSSELTPDEWQSLIEWHKGAAIRNERLPHLLELLCPECCAKIEGSGLHDADPGEFETRIYAAMTRLTSKFASPAQQRRLLHMFEGITEPGTETTVCVTPDGQASINQNGLNAMAGVLSERRG